MLYILAIWSVLGFVLVISLRDKGYNFNFWLMLIGGPFVWLVNLILFLFVFIKFAYEAWSTRYK